MDLPLLNTPATAATHTRSGLSALSALSAETANTAAETTADTAATEWPDRSVVDEALADPSWRPLPFTQFVVKAHGRCNLACDYCYIYEMADQSWRGKPMAMARETVDRTAYRINEHLTAHRDEVAQVIVTFLGGEALLVGPDELDHAAGAFRSAMPDGVEAILSVTTNGVLLDDPRMLAVLERHDIKVTLSLDGARDAHDRHRKYANGKGSFDAVMRGVAALRAAATVPDRLRNVLCVVDLDNDPLETYEALAAVGAPQVDFLLPLDDWEHTPPGWTGDTGGTAYADWLIPIFDHWYGTVPVPTTVRFFDSIIGLVLGGHSTTEAVGLEDFQSLTIDTDGSIELIDALKSNFQGAPLTGLNVRDNAFDEARLHPGVVARQRGAAGLSPTCRACELREICGGGQYTNRYRAGSGFLNPSVFCTDQAALITHIRDRVLADVARLRAGAAHR